MTQLTKNFKLEEFVRSALADEHGIDNTPNVWHLANIKRYLAPGMQRVREALDVPVIITSGYRSQMLNHKVKGSPHSQHAMGLAADFRAPKYGTPVEICELLDSLRYQIGFDQLIDEDGLWVHISFDDSPRREVLTARFDENGVAKYVKGLS